MSTVDSFAVAQETRHVHVQSMSMIVCLLLHQLDSSLAHHAGDVVYAMVQALDSYAKKNFHFKHLKLCRVKCTYCCLEPRLHHLTPFEQACLVGLTN